MFVGGHSPARPRPGGGLGQEREPGGARPLRCEGRRSLAGDDQPGACGPHDVLPALGRGVGGLHPGRARDERGHGLVLRIARGPGRARLRRERIAEGDVDLDGSGRAGGRPAGGSDGARELADERTRGLLRFQVDAGARVHAEEAGLEGGLGCADAAQLAGPIGANDEEGQARVGGLEDGGGQLGDGGAGGDDDGGQRAGAG